MTRIRNLTASFTILAALLVAALAFPGCKLDKGGTTVTNPLQVTCAQPFQLVLAVKDACTGAAIEDGADASAVPVSTSDGSALPQAPTVEGTPNAGVLSLTPVTACTVFYSGTVNAPGYQSAYIEALNPVARYAEVYLQPDGGCPEPVVCEEPEPCPDCEGCPACPVFPAGYTLDQCLAAPSNTLNPTITLLYCCNTPPIDNSDPACAPYIEAP